MAVKTVVESIEVEEDDDTLVRITEIDDDGLLIKVSESYGSKSSVIISKDDSIAMARAILSAYGVA